MAFDGEKIFNSAQQLKYVFQPAKGECDFLVVGFSGFAPADSLPRYNYLRTLKGLNVNKLSILDDQGERGCYYLGKNRVFDVEVSAIALITSLANENNIPHSNIICCGSSKGGYASLYFGIKYGFGHVIAGAPQTLLGNYLYYVGRKCPALYPTLEFISGGTSEEDIRFLNNLLFDVVESAKKIPDILIHVGSGDHHYKGHVQPFIQHLKNNGFDCILDIGDFSSHNEVTFFQKLLVEKITEKVPHLKDAAKIESVDVVQNRNRFTIRTKANKTVQYAWYVFRDGERIEMQWYKPDCEFIYEAKDAGIYHFLAFIRNDNGETMSEATEKFEVI